VNFRKMRLLSGLSQCAVAEYLGLTQGAVSQWELGESYPSAYLLPKVANIYHCTIDELLMPADDDNPSTVQADDA
jgi:transcriptional regulator with XRE-family HTH domain